MAHSYIISNVYVQITQWVTHSVSQFRFVGYMVTLCIQLLQVDEVKIKLWGWGVPGLVYIYRSTSIRPEISSVDVERFSLK